MSSSMSHKFGNLQINIKNNKKKPIHKQKKTKARKIMKIMKIKIMKIDYSKIKMRMMMNKILILMKIK